MKKTTVVFTKRVGQVTYHYPSWWALDNDGFAIAGPCTNKKAIAKWLADTNRRVKSGAIAPRPLYTAN